MSGQGTACTDKGTSEYLVVSLLVENWKRKYSLRNLQNIIASVKCHTGCNRLLCYVQMCLEQPCLVIKACLMCHYDV